MVATYEIKRNTLSSRWGVWAAEADGNAPVENLLGEFKTRGEAETFREHVNSGQSPQAALAALEAAARAEKQGKSLFGKLRKRGNETAEPASAQKQPTNQVIQIQKHEDEPQVEASEATEASIEPPAAPQERTSFRYEPVKAAEVPASQEMAESVDVPQEEPVPVSADVVPDEPQHVEAESADEEPTVAAAEVEPDEAAITEQEEPEIETTGPQADADEEQAPQAEVIPATDENVPDHKAVRMISRVKARDISAPAPDVVRQQEPEEDDGEDPSGLVNWTFTPPPDVSASEVQQREKPMPVEPQAAVVEPVEETEEQPEQPPAPVSVSQANSSVLEPQPQQASPQNGPARTADRDKVTIDICTARSLQSEAWGDPNIPDKKYSSIASKEYTEVSKAISNGATPEHLREELVHLASVCIAWADAIDKRLASRQEKAA